MQIDNEFIVAAPLEQVWNYLVDVENIAPCAPGAELTEVVDDHTWKGKMNVKVGPVAMSFAGTVTLQDRDDAAHRAVLKADGREQRGRGAASAVVSAALEEVPEGTKVSISTDLNISGAAAQYGRGMIGDVSKRLTGEFASCLQTNMAAHEGGVAMAAQPASEATPVVTVPEGVAQPAAQPTAQPATRPAPQPAAPQPVKGIRLALWAFWRAIVRSFKRIFSRSPD